MGLPRALLKSRPRDRRDERRPGGAAAATGERVARVRKRSAGPASIGRQTVGVCDATANEHVELLPTTFYRLKPGNQRFNLIVGLGLAHGRQDVGHAGPVPPALEL